MSYQTANERPVIPIDGSNVMGACLSRPRSPGSFPAVIVGMELFGVTPYIRQVTDLLRS
ncbi:MAG: hypothetical protein M0036_18165 [Desulfobacteraceae bacterium]|nr:hypothetical protein [Desulfobacteraceae bacterium]